jgi:hypothetical protein
MHQGSKVNLIQDFKPHITMSPKIVTEDVTKPSNLGKSRRLSPERSRRQTNKSRASSVHTQPPLQLTRVPHTADSASGRAHFPCPRTRGPRIFRIPRTKAERKRQKFRTLSFPFPSIPHAFYRKNLSHSGRTHTRTQKTQPRAAAAVAGHRIFRAPPPSPWRRGLPGECAAILPPRSPLSIKFCRNSDASLFGIFRFGRRSFSFGGGGLALHDPEVVEVPPEVASGWSSVREKRKRAQVTREPERRLPFRTLFFSLSLLRTVRC